MWGIRSMLRGEFLFGIVLVKAGMGSFDSAARFAERIVLLCSG